MGDHVFALTCVFNIAALFILFLVSGISTGSRSFITEQAKAFTFSSSLFDVLCFSAGRSAGLGLAYGVYDIHGMGLLYAATGATTVYAVVKAAMFSLGGWEAKGGVESMAVIIMFGFFVSAWLETLVFYRRLRIRSQERAQALAKEADRERERLLFASLPPSGTSGSLQAPRSPLSARRSRLHSSSPALPSPSPARSMYGSIGASEVRRVGLSSSRLSSDEYDEYDFVDADEYRTPPSSIAGLESSPREDGPGVVEAVYGIGTSGRSEWPAGYEDAIAGAYTQLEVYARDEGWVHVGSSGGVESFRRKHAGTSLFAVKGVGNIAAPPAHVYALLRDTSRRGEWDPMFVSHSYLEIFNERYRITHYAFSAPGPVQGRDMVVLAGSTVQADGAIHIVSFSVEHSGAPAGREYVRAHLHFAGYVLEPSDGGTRVTYINCVDLKGWLLSSVKNYVATQSTQAIERLRVLVEATV
ncbi:uncharacterized protein AMSG_05449 [Thecamonas trahens ATCC 50062]|uniref:START domain-containing protein n=1 Tax=Thecamonas trahens ATCC 50062 TaxID=461836 RepID=A0A0L0DDQ8_THETB|nr:hypothetical protein AMSG_05449 [Thecamonas trahens ATCC 50062]KNC49443.1 hypothetical protein AMSG_05449 [Thecamonas trahens ATCC 50062]|eukprot:XP_013757864.1 hypothetical protein AMSG_05449 [Thecamonas trahens ATCC 50062]